MSAPASPDQKGSAGSTPPPEGAAPETSPGKAQQQALNANAKSFVPRLESAGSTPPPQATTPAKSSNAPSATKSKRGSNDGSPKAPNYHQTQQAQLQQAALHQQQQAMLFAQQQAALAYGLNPAALQAPITPLTGVMPHGYNPNMMMSPMMVAALAASGRGVPPSPFAAAGVAQPGTNGSPVGVPTQHVPVNVGNASLQALRAQGPARFACVLLVGMPRVGKTTIGRDLVNQLKQDDLHWSFFSGGDYLRDTPMRPAPWDTTKDVYDALSTKLDELQKSTANIKGLIIDKQCRGTEELYYLTALLKSKGLHLNGVVGLVADDDTRLMERLGETDNAFREKCKFHRVIQTRIREASKAAGLWHPVDALEDQDVVVRRVRSMVLGCSSQSPHKQLSPANYHDGQSTMVDDYATYARVMGELVKLTRMAKPSQFPGFTNYTPLSTQILNKKSALKDYAIRRRSDGTKYVLVYDGEQLYLVPRHMRCVFHLRNEAWLGMPLSNVAKFVLDGDLVRLSKERGKEKFLVQDMICWHDKGNPTSNTVARMSWSERQERLKVNICGETSAFYSNCDIVVAHQTFVDIKSAVELFDPCDYSTDGFVFHPRNKRDDATYTWRSPENVAVDFRLGAGTSTGEGTKRYSVQVFDQREAKFVEYGTDTVTIQENRQFVVEGALVVCTLKPDEAAKPASREWHYVRTRTDIPTAAFKSYVDDLLANCLIPKVNVLTYLGIDPAQPRPTTSPPPAGTVAPLGTQQAPVPGQQQRGAFGSALTADAMLSAADAELAAAAAAAPLGTKPATVAALESVVPRGAVHAAPATAAEIVAGTRRSDPREDRALRSTAAAPAPAAAAPAATNTASSRPTGDTRPPRQDRAPKPQMSRCADCGKTAEGDRDSGNHKFYCFACWELFEKADEKADARNKRGGDSKSAGRRGGDRPAGGRGKPRDGDDGAATKDKDAADGNRRRSERSKGEGAAEGGRRGGERGRKPSTKEGSGSGDGGNADGARKEGGERRGAGRRRTSSKGAAAPAAAAAEPKPTPVAAAA